MAQDTKPKRSRSSGAPGAGAVRRRPIGLASPPAMKRYQYSRPGSRPRHSTCTECANSRIGRVGAAPHDLPHPRVVGDLPIDRHGGRAACRRDAPGRATAVRARAGSTAPPRPGPDSPRRRRARTDRGAACRERPGAAGDKSRGRAGQQRAAGQGAAEDHAPRLRRLRDDGDLMYTSSPRRRCGVKLAATNRLGSIRHERRPSPDHRRHAARHLRRALSRGDRRVRHLAGGRQRDRCRLSRPGSRSACCRAISSMSPASRRS